MDTTEKALIEGLIKKVKVHYPHLRESKGRYGSLPHKKTGHIFGHYHALTPANVYRIVFGTDSDLIFIKAAYQIRSGKYGIGGTDVQAVVSKKLDKSYGHIIIRPEMLEDKFRELFYSIETDFELHPKFSSKYYFLSENKELGDLFATEHRLELIHSMPDIVIEIIGFKLVAKFSRQIDEPSLLLLLHFLEKI